LGICFAPLSRNAQRFSLFSFLFVTDHGGFRTEEFETQWLIAGPGVRANRTLIAPVHAVDTAPTILAMLGYVSPAQWQGKIVSEALESPQTVVPVGNNPEGWVLRLSDLDADCVAKGGLEYDRTSPVGFAGGRKVDYVCLGMGAAAGASGCVVLAGTVWALVRTLAPRRKSKQDQGAAGKDEYQVLLEECDTL
jgi:PIN domain nuclease of toxin-antitoxin system